MNPTADEINQRRGYPTPLDSAADAHMRAVFDKRIAGMRGYEAALSATQSLRIEGGLLKFEGVSGGDVITPLHPPARPEPPSQEIGEHAGNHRPALLTAAAR